MGDGGGPGWLGGWWCGDSGGGHCGEIETAKRSSKVPISQASYIANRKK